MENITIPMEEYKELLIIKGKYEELKGQQNLKIDWHPREIREMPLTMPTIYKENKKLPNSTTITCNSEREV